MQIERLILCAVFPPLAVIDKSTNDVILVAFFTVLGWVPGVMVAFGITLADAYWQREYAKRAAAQDQMRDSVRRKEQLVNLPDQHRSDEDRYQLALRAEAMRKRRERGQPR